MIGTISSCSHSCLQFTMNAFWSCSLVVLTLLPHYGESFLPGLKTATMAPESKNIMGALEYVLPNTMGVSEEACLDIAKRMQVLPVQVPADIQEEEQVGISFVHWPVDSNAKKTNVPIILVHGFDSSCMEYRRLGPLLAAEGFDTYAVDLLGWGFTQLNGVKTFSADAKVTALSSFIQQVSEKSAGEFCIVGASLGGAAAIEVAASDSNCAALVLIDAQGFVDGIGPMAMMPKAIAKIGVEVLKSVPLRSSANQMSYFDKETFATDEAVTIGRLHCLREGWSDALVSFMQSGGFSPSEKLSRIGCPSLVLWGRQDVILDGEQFLPRFLETIPNAEARWVEECGHVPHLEKPDETAKSISEFLTSRVVPSTADTPILSIGLKGWIGVAGIGAAATIVVAGQVTSF